MTDIELLPLPEPNYKWLGYTAREAEAIARAVAEHNIAARDAQIAQLEKANDQLHAHGERMHEQLQKMRAAQQPAAPSGETGGDWVLVPRVPTDAMLDAMHGRIQILCDPAERTADIQNDAEVWGAMLTAAPQQPVAEAQPVYVGVDLEGGWIRATAPPSAPVGVEGLRRWADTDEPVERGDERPTCDTPPALRA